MNLWEKRGYNLGKIQIINNSFHLGDKKPAPTSDMHMIDDAREILNVRKVDSILKKEVFV